MVSCVRRASPGDPNEQRSLLRSGHPPLLHNSPQPPSVKPSRRRGTGRRWRRSVPREERQRREITEKSEGGVRRETARDKERRDPTQQHTLELSEQQEGYAEYLGPSVLLSDIFITVNGPGEDTKVRVATSSLHHPSLTWQERVRGEFTLGYRYLGYKGGFFEPVYQLYLSCKQYLFDGQSRCHMGLFKQFASVQSHKYHSASNYIS